MALIKDILNKEYTSIEAQLTGMLDTVSCKEGCAHCCHLYVISTIADAINIAEEILTKRPGWQILAKQIQGAAKKMTSSGMNAYSWFDLQEPCVFLNVLTRTCDIYSVRPAECRFYFVVSPPVQCSIQRKGEKVRRYDLLHAEAHYYTFCYMGLCCLL